MAGTGAVVGGAVLLAIVGAVLVQVAKKKKETENLIEECFVRQMVTNTFTMEEVRGWIAQRKESLEKGGKAFITMLDQENLGKFGLELPVKENMVIKNYLLIAIIDAEQSKIQESALVRYEKLEQSLKAALDKGKGSMVITA